MQIKLMLETLISKNIILMAEHMLKLHIAANYHKLSVISRDP